MALNIFTEKQIEFLQRIAQSRAADTWLEIFEALISYLSDSRTIPVVSGAPDIEKAMGQALLQRRAAAKIIEEQLIELIRQNTGEKQKATQRSDYR